MSTVGIWGLNGDGRKAKKKSQTVLIQRAKRKHKSQAPVLDAAYEKDDFDLNDLVGSLKKEEPVKLEAAATVSSSTTATATTSGRSQSIPSKEQGSVARDSQEQTQSKKDSQQPDFDPEVEEEKLLRQLKLDAQQTPDNSIVKSGGRLPGESKKAYHRRVLAETRQIIKNTRMEQHNPENRQRKKEFLNNKKRK